MSTERFLAAYAADTDLRLIKEFVPDGPKKNVNAVPMPASC